jgi:hypothetical protein
MSGGYRIEPLADHDRKTFISGSESLDRYFREGVTQDMRRRVANCFVAIGLENDVAGFYTLAATSVLLDVLAPDRRKKLPRYPLVPAILLGRLAVARRSPRGGCTDPLQRLGHRRASDGGGREGRSRRPLL